MPNWRSLGAVLALFLSACANTALPTVLPSPVEAQSALQVGADERLFTVDSAHSQVHIYAFSAGPAAALGHNHVLVAPRFGGQVLLNEKTLAQSRFALSFRLDELQLDPPDLRTQLGGGFTTRLPPDAIAATREHMLGESNLQAASFPRLRVRSLQMVGAEPKFAAQIEVELHGRRQTQWVALTLNRQDAHLSASGALVLRQSDFDIAPYSVLGGLLAVADELVVEFEISAMPSAAAAAAD